MISNIYKKINNIVNRNDIYSSKIQDILAKKIRMNGDPLREMREAAKNGARLVCLTEKNNIHGRGFFLTSLGFETIVYGYPDSIRKSDIIVCFGYTDFIRNSKKLFYSNAKNIYFFESGYLRSIVMDKSGSEFDRAVCFFIDDLGFHYDPTRPSRLELMLNDPSLQLTNEERERSKKIIRLLVENKLTKYNDQKIDFGIPPSKANRILVAEQARNDWSVVKSGGGARNFTQMLSCAIMENPDSEVLVKVHPDTINGKRGGLRKSYFGRITDSNRVKVIYEKINPYSLIECVDKVYVFSSMIGFEALLMNKEVHVFGKAAYAGWGVTVDRCYMPNRVIRRNLEDIVYIIYVLYCRYVNDFGEECSAEDAIQILLERRDKYISLNENRTST